MKKICNSLFILLVLLSIISCDNYMDVHKEYFKGEIIYAPKPISVQFLAGRERVGFRCVLDKSPNVRFIQLIWNNNVDTLNLPVNPSAEMEIISTFIPNLREASYTFKVRTIDLNGNVSLFLTNVGTAYGDIYESTLVPRVFLSAAYGILDKAPRIYMKDIDSRMANLIQTEIRYHTTAGGSGIALILPDESNIIIPDAEKASSFEYRSLYIPEALAVDTFATAWETASFPPL